MSNKKEAALVAIQKLFEDTTVPPSKTLDALKEIADEVNAMMQALRDDID